MGSIKDFGKSSEFKFISEMKLFLLFEGFFGVGGCQYVQPALLVLGFEPILSREHDFVDVMHRAEIKLKDLL
jgi:hypothetical protein